MGMLLLVSCSVRTNNHDSLEQAKNAYTQELQQLKSYFKIPGMAVLIKKDGKKIYEDYLGEADQANNTKPDSTTLFPIASLTKTFTGVLVMKLVEQGKLSLNDSLKKYLPGIRISDAIQVKHLLSHTSQGKVGEKFYYSTRFGALTKVIAQASGKSFQQFLEAEIFKPLQLKNTFCLKDSAYVARKKVKIAQAYQLNDAGAVKQGRIEYGISASAGIVSTVRDLAIFDEALDHHTLISEKSTQQMFKAFKPDLPYGYGIFSQQVLGKKLFWGYGQYDCYSGLYLKVPSAKLSLFILANNNLMSDPARLIYGDAGTSLFVLSFLKNFVLNKPSLVLLETTKKVSSPTAEKSEFHRKKLLAQALAASFMARYDTSQFAQSTRLLQHTFQQYPDYVQYGTPALMHNLMFLKNVAFHRKLGKFDKFDQAIELLSKQLLQADPQNPYLHVYAGTYHDRKGNKTQARVHFKQIVEASNFSKFWYTYIAQQWLEENPESK